MLHDTAIRAGGRARALPPEQRRSQLIEATLQLIREHGLTVTTRQIAEASGVAEGTIFRVFPDKDALIRAAFLAGCDPAPLLAQLDAIDGTLPLRARLEAIVTLLQHRAFAMFGLLSAMRISGPPTIPDQDRRAANDLINARVTRLLKADRDQFRLPPTQVARMLRLLVFSGSHPLITDGRLLTPDEIVTLVLDGVLRREDIA